MNTEDQSKDKAPTPHIFEVRVLATGETVLRTYWVLELLLFFNKLDPDNWSQYSIFRDGIQI